MFFVTIAVVAAYAFFVTVLSHAEAWTRVKRLLLALSVALLLALVTEQDEYQEEEDHRIVPREAGTLGIHTFNRAGDLTVADAFERRPRF